MKKYKERISDNSIWVSATPTPFAKSLPFCVTEAGLFIAEKEYSLQRKYHDSFLLLYTIDGEGFVRSDNGEASLSRNHAVIIDCRTPHEYHSAGDTWKFIWIHFNGSGTQPLFDAAYPNRLLRAACMENFTDFEKRLNDIIVQTQQSSIAAYIHLSSLMHSVFNSVFSATFETDKSNIKYDLTDDVRTIINFIEENYANPITIDDMKALIPVSKYHFIRCFKRAMGMTPYSYLTNYRINVSKTLLRSSDKSVSQIAELCGFIDTSNFINHFKKHTGQKPLQYRRDFL